MLRQFGSLLVIGCLTACGSDDSSEASHQPVGSAVLADGARVLDREGSEALESATADGQLVFSHKSATLSELGAGNVLIVGVTRATPNGALLAVDSVTEQGNGVLVQGHAATLEQTFRELHLAYHATVKSPQPITPAAGPLSDPPKQQGLAFPLELGASDANGSATLSGAVSIAPSIDFDLDVDVAALKLKTLTLSFAARETFVANFVAHGSASFDRSTTLATLGFTPITLVLPSPIGPIPLVLTPTLSLDAALHGSAQGDVSADVSQEAALKVGLGYKDGSFGTISDHDSKFNAEEPTYAGSVNAKALAGPRFEVKLWDLVGPFATAQAFVELNASAEGPPPCARGRIDAGLAATVGVDFLADYETTLFNQTYPLASFDSCTKDPNAPRPALTWARSFGRQGSGGERAKAVVPLADGTYVVVGDSNWFGGINAFGAALWALRLDALGNVMWQRAFGRSYRQGLAQGAASVSDGVLVLGTGGVIKLDVGGNVIWAKSYTADQPLNLASIAARSDGSFVVAGTVGTSARGFASGLDARGNVLWSRVYGGSGFARVRTTSDGGSILIGQTDSNNGDAYVVKLDAGGNVAWQRAIDNAYDSSGGTIPNPPPLGSSNDSGNDIAEKPGGGYVVVGTGYGAFPMPEPTSLGYYAAFEADLGSDGSLAGTGSQLYRAPSDALYTAGYAVLVRPDGTTLIAGRRANQSSDLGGKEDVLMIQGGTFSSLGGSGNDAILSGALAGNAAPLAATLDGGAILAATTSSFGGQEQFWVVKLNRAGNINFPYRANLSGASYTNEHATSVSLGTQATDLPIAVTSFDSELQSEVTPISSLQQAP